MKKVIIFFICIFTVVIVKAQEYKELNNSIYKINFDDDNHFSNPLRVMMVLKLDKASKTYKKTTLKKGKYEIKSVKEKNEIYKFTIDRKGLFQDKIYIEREGENQAIMTVENSLIKLLEAGVEDEYIKIIPNNKDSLIVFSVFNKKDDFKKQEFTVFLSKKYKGKKLGKEFRKDGSYIEINEITGKYKYYNKDGEGIIIQGK